MQDLGSSLEVMDTHQSVPKNLVLQHPEDSWSFCQQSILSHCADWQDMHIIMFSCLVFLPETEHVFCFLYGKVLYMMAFHRQYCKIVAQLLIIFQKMMLLVWHFVILAKVMARRVVMSFHPVSCLRVELFFSYLLLNLLYSSPSLLWAVGCSLRGLLFLICSVVIQKEIRS